MPLNADQKRERIARRIALAALISLWSLSALALGRSEDSAGNAKNLDGARAYEHVRHLMEIGPRPPESDGIHRAQAYIIGQLKSFGSPPAQHTFPASPLLPT